MKLKQLIIISMMGAISFVLMFLSFPLPFLPPFLRIDISDLPALVITLLFGPLAGITVELLKGVLYFIFASTAEPIGPLANFLASVIFLYTLFILYKKMNKSFFISGIIATLMLTITMTLLNYFVLLPMYGMIMNLDDIVSNIKTIVTAGIIPFNMIKGLMLTILLYILNIKLIPMLRDRFL
ncbi:ECF transporter S component [Abyssicoccus albus]|uniref:Riboflavin transporter n=1 Tax=Abyssicoccus albus TaxID=1817405 RepID=A0A3N5BJL0_9BACL|nr:ECF transporter S component [Abyssicoccus albus]RPF58044.1 riboflavin transporter FmnP [Abyssicoccus albus]